MGAWFVKGTKNDVIDGKKAPWMVVVPIQIDAGHSDLVEVQKSDGSVSWARLVTEYPYTTAASNAKQRRWTFTSADPDGNPDRIARENATFDVEQAARTDLDVSDGRPVWWSRKEDGSVRWPQSDQVWSDRETGELGMIVRDQMSSTRIGWYPMASDIGVGDLDVIFADGVERQAGSPGVWLFSGEVMDRYSFAWKRTSRTEHIRLWARANGFVVKDQGNLSRKVVAAFEAEHAPESKTG